MKTEEKQKVKKYNQLMKLLAGLTVAEAEKLLDECKTAIRDMRITV